MSKPQEYDLSVLADATILAVFEIKVADGDIDVKEIGLLVKSPMVDDKLAVIMSKDTCKIVRAKDCAFPWTIFTTRI